MGNLANFLVSTPEGFWFNIIGAFESFVPYAWAIILITMCIKIVLVPLDFFNKKVSRETSLRNATLMPKMQQLQQKYGHDKNLLNQKTAELYRSSGMNLGGSCVVMLVYLVVTMVVFFTLFTSLNTNSTYKIEQQYLELRETYQAAYVQTTDDPLTVVNEKEVAAQNAVLEAYENRTNGFLWVKNVYLADNPWTNSILSFDEYLNLVGNNVRLELNTESVSYSELSQEQKDDFKAEYESVTKILQEKHGGPNGYLITFIVAVLTAFFSQYFIQKQTNKKTAKQLNQNPQAQKTNKIMLIILPAIMGLITLFYNAVFGLYIIANQLVAILTFPLIDKILDVIQEKKQKKEQEKIQVDYRRK